MLGTGGLVKAYSSATMEALNKAKIVHKELGKEVKIVVTYADLEKLKYYLKQNEIHIADVEYQENVCVMTEMTEQKIDSMLAQKENLIFKILACEILKEKFITIM